MFADAADAWSREPDGRAMSTTTAPRRGKEKPRWLATARVPLLEVDAHLLGGLDVVAAGFVAGPHLDDGVVAVTGDEPHGARRDLHRRGDGLGGIESGH